MRKVIFTVLIAGLLAACPSAWAQISLVHVTTCGAGNFPGTTCTIPATGSGNLIVVGWDGTSGGNSGTKINSVTDNAGNTYVEAGVARSVDANLDQWMDIWYAKNSKSGATSIVITPSASVTNSGAVIWEFSGIDGTSPLDQTGTLNSQASTLKPSGAPVTIAAANEAVISVAGVGTYVTGLVSGSPFVTDSTLFANGWAHYVTSSMGTYSAQWNQSPAGTCASSTVSFKAAGIYSLCDLNQDASADIIDVQLATNMALAPANCTAPFGQCNTGFVQAVLTNAMGGTCVLPVLGVAPTSISFGNVSVGSTGTQSVTLTGSGTSATTISQASVSGAGFAINGLSLPLTLSVGQSANFNVTFAPASAASVSGSITFTSTGLDTPFSVPLSGTGVTTIPHSVTLNWVPSTSSNVASYNVYRITSTSSTAPPTPYPSLTSIAASTCTPAACTYTDSAIQAGQSYWYYATAVDTSNSVSVPSNQARAIVPTP